MAIASSPFRGCRAARRPPRHPASARAPADRRDRCPRSPCAPRAVRCTADRSRHRACGTASRARRPDPCRAPPCAGRRSGRRTGRRPCRSADARRSRLPATRGSAVAQALRRAGSAASSKPGRELQHVEGAARIAVGRACDQLQRPGLDGRAAPRRDRVRCPRAPPAQQRRPGLPTVSARSTYTRARDSNALTTSKDGFSVVAPMNVSVPSSRYGRNVSCCALLKRCTSSRNSSVARPVARPHCARGFDRGADILHARHDGRQRDELRVGGLRDEPRERRLAACPADPRGSGNAAAPRRCSPTAACRARGCAAARRTPRDCAAACDRRAAAANRAPRRSWPHAHRRALAAAGSPARAARRRLIGAACRSRPCRQAA